MSEVIQNKIEKLTTKIQALSSDKEKLTHTLESVSLDLELAEANLETLVRRTAAHDLAREMGIDIYEDF
jgi:prefoldin subunit 5